MDSTPKTDRRRHQRHPLTTSLQFYHGPSQRDFPGRCVDISKGGLLMYVPVSAPVQPGQAIRLAVGSVSRPEFAGLSETPLDATIVRVDRHSILSSGQLAVGVRFQGGAWRARPGRMIQ